MGGRLYRAHTTMIEGWEGRMPGPDRLWRVAIREHGDQTVAPAGWRIQCAL
jgi:hypothetical protein